MGDQFIPVAAPVLAGNEKRYVNECLDSTWISSNGRFIEQFEQAFAEFCGTRFAAACSNGTVALHAALLALGVQPGDEVIIPTLTFVATANAVTYCGATPVLADSEADTWNLDTRDVEARITPRTRGIIPVHLYGHPADMDSLRAIAKRHRLFLLEDAAEAHGAEYGGRRVGSLGEIGAFSFFGNKIITTGEGGMVVTDDERLAERMRLLKGQGMDPCRRYWFPMVGYNYRMTNVAAAIGLAQLEMADWHIGRRRAIAAWYRDELADLEGVSWQRERDGSQHADWLFTVQLDEALSVSRDGVMAAMREAGVETRPVFYPMHVMPPYAHLARQGELPVAERLGRHGLSLPTWSGLSREDVHRVCAALRSALGQAD